MSLIVGGVNQVRYTETAADGVTTSTLSAPALVVTKPDGSALSPAATVTDSAVGAAVTHILTSTAFSIDQGGRYKLRWSATRGTETIIRLSEAWAYWTDAPALIRSRLQKTALELSDDSIDREFSRIARMVLDRYACLGTYNSLTGEDRDYFDDAIALMAAYRLKPLVTVGGAAGDLVELKEGDVSQKWSGGGTSAVSERDMWAKEAAAALGQVSCVKEQVTDRAAAFSPFVVSGPTRSARGRGFPEGLYSYVSRLLVDSTLTGGLS
jgi:hypothetical protein